MKSPLYVILTLAAAIAAGASVSCSTPKSVNRGEGADFSMRDTINQTTNYTNQNLGSVQLNYFYDNLLSAQWYTADGILWRIPGKKEAYEVEFKGVKYRAEPRIMKSWRWRFKAIDGFWYYFSIPDKFKTEE